MPRTFSAWGHRKSLKANEPDTTVATQKVWLGTKPTFSQIFFDASTFSDRQRRRCGMRFIRQLVGRRYRPEFGFPFRVHVTGKLPQLVPRQLVERLKKIIDNSYSKNWNRCVYRKDFLMVHVWIQTTDHPIGQSSRIINFANLTNADCTARVYKLCQKWFL